MGGGRRLYNIDSCQQGQQGVSILGGGGAAEGVYIGGGGQRVKI